MNLRKSHWQKSCPSCSAKVGVLVFKPYPQAFGASSKRVGALTKDGAQPWCTACRSEKSK